MVGICEKESSLEDEPTSDKESVPAVLFSILCVYYMVVFVTATAIRLGRIERNRRTKLLLIYIHTSESPDINFCATQRKFITSKNSFSVRTTLFYNLDKKDVLI